MTKRTLLLWALGLSLALNLVALGFAVGHFAGGFLPWRAAHPWMARHLSREAHDLLYQRFRQHEAEARPLQRELRWRQQEALALLDEEDLDAETLRHALTDVREAASDYQRLRHEQLVDALEDLPIEERRVLYHFLARPGAMLR